MRNMHENCNDILSVKDIAYRDDNAGLIEKWGLEDREGKEQGRRELEGYGILEILKA